VISTNSSYAEVARDIGCKKANEVTIVRNGPPAAWAQLAARPRDGVLDVVRLAYQGAISSQDGVEGLAPVLSHLSDSSSPVRAQLTVIGDGDARPAVERALAEHGVADRVTFTGRVDPSRVPELLHDADVCVDPAPPTDVNQRSTMTKIAEYLALGKPVIAYDLREARRTVRDAAFLVQPGDDGAFAEAIVRVARDPMLRSWLAEAGWHRAAMLNWDHSERALLEAYGALRSATSARRARLRAADPLPASEPEASELQPAELVGARG
jgi:glycosyltransferase involved in cell wall biosynthesis